jgi:hypothetical protein
VFATPGAASLGTNCVIILKKFSSTNNTRNYPENHKQGVQKLQIL